MEENEKELEELLEEIRENESFNSGWFLIILFIFLTFENSKEEKLDRKSLIKQISDSDLSNTDKQAIMNIILK